MGEYLNINIPEPCHEDWNKMRPNEHGVFCGSCQKTVVDFSKMGDQQIKDYFLQKSDQKTCGRFSSKQLKKPIAIEQSLNEWNTQLSPLRKFAAALFLVFGTGLFSCTTTTGQIVGEIAIDTLKNSLENEMFIGKTISPMIKGDTIVIEKTDSIENVPQSELLEGDISILELNDVVMTSGLVTVEIPNDKIEVQELDAVEISTIRVKEIILPVHMVMGGARMVSCFGTEAEEIAKQNPNTNQVIEPELPTTDKPKLSATVYPNPVKHYLNLEINIPEAGEYKIDMFSMDGKSIRKTSKRYEIGIYKEQIDVAGLTNGVYFYSVSSEKYSRSGKVVVVN